MPLSAGALRAGIGEADVIELDRPSRGSTAAPAAPGPSVTGTGSSCTALSRCAEAKVSASWRLT